MVAVTEPWTSDTWSSTVSRVKVAVRERAAKVTGMVTSPSSPGSFPAGQVM